MGVKNCPKCDIPAMPNKTFCFRCGTKLEELPENPDCVNCGESVAPHHKFCTGCGLSREEALAPKPENKRPLISVPPPGASEETVKTYQTLQEHISKEHADKEGEKK